MKTCTFHRATTLALICLVSAVSLPAFASAAAHEAPVVVKWTPGTLRNALTALPTGNPDAGKKVHDELFCASCHGPAGVAPTQNWPHLAGQKSAYTAKMMLDYQDKRRLEGRRAEMMHDIAVMLSPQQIADVAAFYAVQSPPTDDGTPRPRGIAAPKDVPATTLVRRGDKTRLITPCASCHGVVGQGGKLEASALAGQNPLYFVRTMLDFQGGTRHNDSIKGMSLFAKKLSRSEIEALAIYYADLPVTRTK
ncbi:c-type cytochrome [Rhodoferax antarcticus]|uniref:Putative cytochrome c n=1 Tax=Rhodoferax antarcticus ANT.BR TaxID=1111071 RepID=A0A1Q8YCB7_9BURK|nr:c-type cytochrome [Rhodoferax antarcticus]APW46593.1 hypothetical protein RA876_09685 [Rhodoferax antarcticus]MCW2313220.1 cytochrome c553 [Rhodoferax antarcticus]OLP05460.1 putative cytochrome c [Rhodoferax antarcticus ANT.BR]